MTGAALAISLMDAFAARATRYLWTDAFAVANDLGLARATEGRSRAQALALIDRVHGTLGRRRPDDARQGWIDGASEEHPTRGGLRIGKPLPERRLDEPFDDELEWERDGQYFHYLTRWVHALDLATRHTGDARYTTWARELVQRATAAFVTDGRMNWKMSIDLDRPQVRSMGHHDPLEGYVACAQLAATAGVPVLVHERAAYARLLEGADLTATDPLGIGGLLIDAARLTQIGESDLSRVLVAAARRGLLRQRLAGPAERRLAFRELGLAIGLAAPFEELAPYRGLRDDLVGFWSETANRDNRTFSGHRDINEVMLASALVPDAVLAMPALELSSFRRDA